MSPWTDPTSRDEALLGLRLDEDPGSRPWDDDEHEHPPLAELEGQHGSVEEPPLDLIDELLACVERNDERVGEPDEPDDSDVGPALRANPS